MKERDPFLKNLKSVVLATAVLSGSLAVLTEKTLSYTPETQVSATNIGDGGQLAGEKPEIQEARAMTGNDALLKRAQADQKTTP